MLEGILGRGFTSKCKSLIKLTKSRIDVIRRKRNATLKFLKKDIADLLSNGLDINAYGRAEGLLAELIQSSCYDFVEKSCDFVLKHLPVMQKISHCPEDCRVAVSSLMFAAARFSDLPELRDLRHIFYERYGNSVELFANQEFVKNLSSKAFTMEQKVRLMKDIASEFSIRWDSRAFEQRMSKPSASTQDQPKIYGSVHIKDDKYKSINGKISDQKGEKHDFISKERLEHVNDGYRLFIDKEGNFLKGNEFNPQSRPEVPSNGYRPISVREETILKRDNHGILFQDRQEARGEKYETWQEDTPLKTVRLGSSSQKKRMESFDGGSKPHDGRENTMPKRDAQDALAAGKSDIGPACAGLRSKSDDKESLPGINYVGQHNIVNSTRDVWEEEHKLKHYYNNAIPPPYTKPNTKLKDGKYGASLGSFHTGPKDLSGSNRDNTGDRSGKIQQGAYHPDHEKQSVVPTRETGQGHGNDNRYWDDGVSNPIPKPRSSRRRRSKTHSTLDDVVNVEDAGAVKRRPRSRRRDESRQGLQTLFDDKSHRADEEERMIDRLLLHYSKKPSTHDHENMRRKPKSRHAHHKSIVGDKLPQDINRDGPDEISETVPPPPRSISLPHEQTTSLEAKKVFTRAASFQPDGSSPARHVHPKLPDYDDLAARFAALKGR